MILALLLAAASGPTALDAERAFAAAAQAKGQWTAFREYAAPDATMFVPQPINAQSWLKDRKDPAKAIEWWPTASYVSCDGSLAVNTGGWERPDGAVGYFSTVWQRQPDGSWKWIVDGGDELKVARKRPVAVSSRKASCKKHPARKADIIVTGTIIPSVNRKLAIDGSKDNSLTWGWIVESNGSRVFTTSFWNGRTMETAIFDKIAAPK